MAPEENEKQVKDEELKDEKQSGIAPEAGHESDDDETWTNAPAKEEETALAEEEEHDDYEPELSPAQIKTAKDLLIEEVGNRVRRAHQRLRSQLRGQILVEIQPGRERYVLDGSADVPSVSEYKGEPALKSNENKESSGVDCIIKVTEPDLFSVRSGDLNPQLAMVGGRIQVLGQVGLGIYFFNLVAPRGR